MSARTGDPVKTVVPNYHGNDINRNSVRRSTDIKALLMTSPAWPPVRCGRQGRAIVANQVST